MSEASGYRTKQNDSDQGLNPIWETVPDIEINNNPRWVSMAFQDTYRQLTLPFAEPCSTFVAKTHCREKKNSHYWISPFYRTALVKPM